MFNLTTLLVLIKNVFNLTRDLFVGEVTCVFGLV